MLPKLGSLSQHASERDRRSADRRSLKLSLDSADGPGEMPAVILDISSTGMRFVSHGSLKVGDRLDVELPEAGTVSARIVRKVSHAFGTQFGAEFREPISKGAVSAAILSASPSTPTLQEEEAMRAMAEQKLSYRARAGIIVGITIVLWAMIVGMAYAFARLL